MSGEVGIRANTDDAAANREVAPARRLVPMKVGNAQVYVETFDGEADIESVPGLRPVSLDPTDAFARASDALRECVAVVGERLDRLAEDVKPHEVGVEFTISFDVEGKANIVPVLLSGKAKSTMGVKVSALWKPGAPRA